jgi:hypothetical protein
VSGPADEADIPGARRISPDSIAADATAHFPARRAPDRIEDREMKEQNSSQFAAHTNRQEMGLKTGKDASSGRRHPSVRHVFAKERRHRCE